MKTTDDLLGRAGQAGERKQLAEAAGIDAGLLLEWVNHVDLMRIPGVGSEYSDLLEAAGVDSSLELAQRNPANLAAALAAADEQKSLVRALPSETVVAKWVEAAKGMEKVVRH